MVDFPLFSQALSQEGIINQLFLCFVSPFETVTVRRSTEVLPTSVVHFMPSVNVSKTKEILTYLSTVIYRLALRMNAQACEPSGKRINLYQKDLKYLILPCEYYRAYSNNACSVL